MRASSVRPGRTYSVPSAWGTRTASACAPGTDSVPKKPPCTQEVLSPSWQKTHVPSEKANGMMTKSPTLTVRTSEPTLSTTPIASCPMRRPVWVCAMSLYGQRSLPQIEARVIVTRASVGSIKRASGTLSTRTSPAPNITVARILFSSLTCSPRTSLLEGQDCRQRVSAPRPRTPVVLSFSRTV